MTNLKKLLLSTLAIGSVLVPSAQAAYETDGVRILEASDFSGAHSTIVDGLEKLGVPVVDGASWEGSCEAEEGYTLYGWYHPEHNIMVLCTEGMTRKDIEETLTHEAVHAIQDARAGINNSEMDYPNVQPLFEALSPEYQHNILNSYDQEDWEIETEAWYFQDKPEVVADVFTF